MFDLSEAIDKWRQDIASREVGDGRTVEELEGHLREEVANLAESGLSEEEAFLIAARRLGDSSGLAREFRKVHGAGAWMRRIPWMGAGILAYLIVSGFYAIAGLTATWLGASVFGLEGNALAIVAFVASAFAMIAASAGVLLSFYVMSKMKTPFAKMNNRAWGGFLILLFVGYALTAASLFAPVAMFRFSEMEAFSQISMANSYVNLAWKVLFPAAIVVVSVVSLIRRRRLSA